MTSEHAAILYNVVVCRTLHAVDESFVVNDAVVDGEDLSSYDQADEKQQQTMIDSATLDQLQHELTSLSLGRSS